MFFAIFFSGLPAPRGYLISILLFFTQGSYTILDRPLILIFILGPFILILIAYLRGKRINKAWLAFFPIAAFILAFGPILVEIIYYLFKPRENSQGFIVWRSITSIVTFYGPIVVHLACLAFGCSSSKNESQEPVNLGTATDL
jgi:hypothetical protein